jgi:saccharopine dehydrogenase-like NADP-dependent oxidoreductase
MKEVNILVVGGYGIVGKDVVKLLSAKPQIKVFVGGRNADKAKEVANAYNCEWKNIDVQEKTSVEEAIKDIDIVVNCFISTDTVNISVAEIVVNTGKKYLDVAGVPLEHQYKIKELDAKAKSTGALLITGFGLNPGIAGILLQHHARLLSKVETSEIFFTMGANFDDISLLSLIGIGDLMLIPPKVYFNGAWVSPKKSSNNKHINTPFNKKIYFSPGAITPDLIDIPKSYDIKHIAFWSGIESLWMSMILYFGVKLGRTKTQEKASKLLKRLKKLGSKKKYHDDTNLTVISTGLKNEKQAKIETSFYCSEVYAPALAPVLGCSLIWEGKMEKTGAYYATEIVNANDFIVKLKESNINFTEDLSEK